MKHRLRVSLTALVLGLIFFAGGDALALSQGCLDLGGAPLITSECQINSKVFRGGAFNVSETLHITGTGIIDLTSALTVNIGGDLVMDAGSMIDGNTAAGFGFNITLNVTGDVSLAKPSGSTPGAIIRSNSKSGGTIVITSKGSIDIDGTVESVGSISGTGANQAPGGGPITINAACNLQITPDGKVSSRGADPGADLVHLQGGCKVLIDGLVESSGVGHGTPNNPVNHCDHANRPDKPTNSTACVEIWAGDFLTITATGEVNADTGGPGGSGGTSWIDAFANGDITITGDVPGSPGAKFAMHANGNAGTNDNGGTVTVKSIAGNVTTGGTAISANALGNGGKGGAVDVEASANVAFGTAWIQAKGAPGGGAPAGGKIFGRAWNGTVLGAAPGKLDAGGGNPPNGNVELMGCGTAAAGDGVAYPNTPATVVPYPATIDADACGGAPSLPLGANTYVVLPTCLCGCFCLSGFSVDQGVLTIHGQGLTGVSEVDFTSNCDPNSAVSVKKNAFLTPATDGTIILTLPGGTSRPARRPLQHCGRFLFLQPRHGALSRDL